MKKKCAKVISSLLLVISLVALAANGECAQAANHLDFGAEHNAPRIHCPDAFLNSNIQAATPIWSGSWNLSKVPPSIHEKIKNIVSVAWFKDHPFREPFSQQDLFRFEKVYRL